MSRAGTADVPDIDVIFVVFWGSAPGAVRARPDQAGGGQPERFEALPLPPPPLTGFFQGVRDELIARFLGATLGPLGQ